MGSVCLWSRRSSGYSQDPFPGETVTPWKETLSRETWRPFAGGPNSTQLGAGPDGGSVRTEGNIPPTLISRPLAELDLLLVPRHLCLRALLGVVGYPFLPTWLACVVFWMCTICDSWIECWLLIMYLQCRDSYLSLLPGPATNRYSGRWPK